MPQTKARRNAKKRSTTKTQAVTNAGPEVMTLAEAAGYLRVPKSDVLQLASRQALPGRKIGAEWRFLKAALEDWLNTPRKSDFWKTHFGALKNDPYLEEMLQDIYRRRGRPETEVRELGRLARLLTTDH